MSVLVSVGTTRPRNQLILSQLNMEARVGIEPTMQLLQSRALPLGYPAFQRTANQAEPPVTSKQIYPWIIQDRQLFLRNPANANAN